jgi:DNA-binding SARP family transcriptional activator
MEESLDFLILGPFQVIGQQPLALGGPRQRAVLALLLLNRREVVTTDRMIEELWGEHPPATVGKAIHVYVSNLRKVVGDGVLLTCDGGYKLDVEPGQVDADRFDGLVASGRTALERGYPVVARRRLREALGLWRGRPLADFSYHQFTQAEIARLEEARIAALEDRIEAELALGAHSTLVPELEKHVRAHPARERLWGQLMVALYRSGRQADALERYRRARGILIEEFAIDPGRDLKELGRAILTQDPALDVPALDTANGRERPPSLPDPAPDVAPGPPSPRERRGVGRADADSDASAPEPNASELHDSTITASRGRVAIPRSAELRSRLRALALAADANWREQRLAIAAGAALLLVLVIIVAVIANVGGSAARPRAAHRPNGCSRCVASIAAPRTGAVYTVGQSVVTSFFCASGSRGQALASCDDSAGRDTKNGGHGRLDTSTPGIHTYTVTVTLMGGATRSASVSYTVLAPLASSIASRIARVSHRRTRIIVRCSGGRPGATCRGTVQLRIRRLIGGRVRLVGIARAPYSASTGSSGTAVLRLAHLGIRALRHAAGHHRRVQVIVTTAGTAPSKQVIRLALG